MSVPSIYNKNGQILTDQTFTIGESSNKVASAKFVVDTVTSEFTTRVTPLTNTVSGLNTTVVDLSSTVVGLKQVTDSSFVKLGNGDLVVSKATNADNAATAANAGNLNLNSGIVYQLQNQQTRVLDYDGSGRLLQSNSPGASEYPRSAPSWVEPSNLTVGKATNIAGPGNYQLLYQKENNVTAKVAVAGLGNRFLRSPDGGQEPAWVTEPEIKAGNLTGGGAFLEVEENRGFIAYQESVGITKYTGLGTVGQVLTYGAFVNSSINPKPVWVNQSALAAGTAATLATSRNIGGVSFDGSQPIIPKILGDTNGQITFFNGTPTVKTTVTDIGNLTAVNAAASAPTQTEFDKVVADLGTLKTKLNGLLAVLRGYNLV